LLIAYIVPKGFGRYQPFKQIEVKQLRKVEEKEDEFKETVR
jgi:hypothetical protein